MKAVRRTGRNNCVFVGSDAEASEGARQPMPRRAWKHEGIRRVKAVGWEGVVHLDISVRNTKRVDERLAKVGVMAAAARAGARNCHCHCQEIKPPRTVQWPPRPGARRSAGICGGRHGRTRAHRSGDELLKEESRIVLAEPSSGAVDDAVEELPPCHAPELMLVRTVRAQNALTAEDACPEKACRC